MLVGHVDEEMLAVDMVQPNCKPYSMYEVNKKQNLILINNRYITGWAKKKVEFSSHGQPYTNSGYL